MTSSSIETRPRRRTTRTERRAGYVAGAVVNVLLLVAVNGWPGWDVLPFLTSDTDRVIALVNASIVAHLAVFALYTVWDPRGVRAAGEILTSGFGIVVTARLWQVYPFDTADDWSGWGLVAHVLVGLGIVGSAIGVVTGVAHLVRACARPE